MITPYFSAVKSFSSVKNNGLVNDEKERIMEKVYNSDVFKEFIRQWGHAMPPLEKIAQKRSVK